MKKTIADVLNEELQRRLERSMVPGLPRRRDAPVNPLQRLDQLRLLVGREYPARLSPQVRSALRVEDMRDYHSILREVRSYTKQQMRDYMDDMSHRKAWDLDELIALHWVVWKASAKLRLAPHIGRSGAWLVESAAMDLSDFVPASA